MVSKIGDSERSNSMFHPVGILKTSPSPGIGKAVLFSGSGSGSQLFGSLHFLSPSGSHSASIASSGKQSYPIHLWATNFSCLQSVILPSTGCFPLTTKWNSLISVSLYKILFPSCQSFGANAIVSFRALGASIA
jgi:hypothetical protein